jgi:hypothetical protein
MTDVDRLIRDINKIALNIGDAVAKRTRCCDTCGCLCFTWETCPACAIANANKETA